jgi:hypothetical protein
VKKRRVSFAQVYAGEVAVEQEQHILARIQMQNLPQTRSHDEHQTLPQRVITGESGKLFELDQ